MRRFDINMLREWWGEDAVAQAYRDLGGQGVDRLPAGHAAASLTLNLFHA